MRNTTAKPCEREDEDVLKDFVTELRLATEPYLWCDQDGETHSEVDSVTLVKTMDDAILTTADWKGECERGGKWFPGSIEWWLRSATPCIINGRNSWRCVYRVDVE